MPTPPASTLPETVLIVMPGRLGANSGEVNTRLSNLPSETMTEVVWLTGSWMPLLTLLSARSTVVRIWIGTCGVESLAWNEAIAMPCTEWVVTLVPVAEPPAEAVLSNALPASPTIS